MQTLYPWNNAYISLTRNLHRRQMDSNVVSSFLLSGNISYSHMTKERCILHLSRDCKENISRSLASFREIAPKASDESRTYIDVHDDWFVQVPASRGRGQSCVQMPYPSAGIDLQFSCKKQD